VDSFNACDPEWARDHVEALRVICMGQARPNESGDNGIREKLKNMK
jgi:hypothetical protein